MLFMLLVQHLNALHAARTIFIQTEAEERIRRAPRYTVRASEQLFENGDSFFTKVKVKSVGLDQER